MKKVVFLLSFLSSLAFAFNVLSSVVNENGTISLYVSGEEFGDKISTLTRDNLVNCEPALHGIYEYAYTDLIVVYPDPRLIKGKTYKCATQSSTFEFATEDFGIKDIKKISNDKIIVKFNDYVNKDTLKSNLKVYKKEKLAKNDILFDLETNDEQTYIIGFKNTSPDIGLEISSALTSKFGVNLSEDFTFEGKNFVLYKDNKNALNLVDIVARPISFNDGTVGVRIYLPYYIQPSAKYLLIDGITNFSVSNAIFAQNDERDSNMNSLNYYVEVRSDEMKPNTTYKMTILKGFGDYYALTRDEKTFEFTTGDRKPFVSFTDDKNFVPKNSVVSFKSTNLPEVNVIVSRVGEQNYRYFLNYQNKNITNLTKEIISKNFTLNGAKNDIVEHKINLDFKEFTDGIYDIGVYFKDGDKGDLNGTHKVVYLSDITANVVVGQDGIFLLASRLSDASILKNAKVEVYSFNNELIASGTTNKNGTFSHSEKNFDKKQPASVVISKDKEQSFVILQKQVNEESNLDYQDRNVTANALVYFSSNIIRPNEDLEGVVVFKNLDFSPIKNLPVKIKIYGPTNNEILNKNITTDKFGMITIKEHMGEKTGVYRLEAIFESHILSSKEFSVENFLPNSIKNEIISTKDEFYSGEDITLSLASRYLFGAPNANSDGYTQTSFFDKKLKIPGYEKFSFVNEILHKEYALTSLYQNFTLDSKGEKQLILAPYLEQKASNAYEALVMFSVLDNSKTISEYKNITIFPGKTIVGISADKDFVNANDNINFRTILLDSKSKKPVEGNLDIEIYKNDYNYVASSDGRWQEQKDINLIDSFQEKLNNFSYQFKNGGNYIVVVNDYLNSTSASANIDVSGYGYYGKQDSKQINSALIKLDKQSYKPGDTIKANINSAINKGLLFVSIVDRSVRTYKTIEISQNETSFELEIPSNFEGGYINAAIFKDANPSSLPLRTYANKEIILDMSEHKPNLTIQAPKTTYNNKDVKVTLSSSPNLKATLFVVDEGALQIINQQELNAFEFFNKASPFGVDYYDIFNDLSTYQSKAKALSVGAGGPLFGSIKNISPVQAKNIKTFKIMQSKITDANGTAEFDFKTPNNFNSKLRVTALVVGDDEINSQNDYIEVKDDIVIKPAVMLYLIKGDEINFPVTLINTTEFDKNVTMSVAHGSNLQIQDVNTSFNLKPMESIHTKFTLKALNLGNSDLNISVDDSGRTFLNSSNLDVISQYPKSTFAKTGYASQKTSFELTDDSYKKLAVGVSQSPAIMNVILEENLREYPYGCTEQITSKLLAYQYNYETDKKDNNKTVGIIKDYVSILLSRLKQDGSFGYWSEFGNTNIFSSIYTADLILSLNDKLNLIGKNQKELILSYLKTGFSDNFARMYADFILNKYGKLQKNEINYIFDNKIYTTNLVTMYMMAEILKKNSLTGELSVVMNEISTGVNNKIFKKDNIYDANFNSATRNAAFALYIHANNFPDNEISQKLVDYITKSVKFEDISSTQERAFILRGFNALKKTKNDKAEFELMINKNWTKYTQDLIKIFDINDTKIELAPKNGLFYSLLSFGYEQIPLKHTMYDKKDYIDNAYNYDRLPSLKIFREFVNNTNKIVDLNSLKVGDTIYSKVNLISNRYLQNVLVDEAASSCFEIINERLYPQPRGEAVTNSIGFEHVDYKDERVISFLNPFDIEVTIFTPYRVVMSGKCTLPAVKAEFMQNENISDYDLEMTHFTIKE